MDAYAVGIRPKQPLVGLEYTPQLYDLLLTKGKQSTDIRQRKLLTFAVNSEDDARQITLTQIYVQTGGEYGGIKGERAIILNTENSADIGHPTTGSSNSTGSSNLNKRTTSLLVCVPINPRDKLRMSGKDGSTSSGLSFQSLDIVLAAISKYTALEQQLLNTLNRWLERQHSCPKSLQCLFRAQTEYRIRMCINNPAFISHKHDSQSECRSSIHGSNSEEMQWTAHEALAKMLAIEKCDKVVMNPLYGSGLPYKTRVDNAVNNRHWGRGVPDYTKMRIHGDSPKPHRRRELQWEKDFPLHKAAYSGDAAEIHNLLAQGFSYSQLDSDSWTPLHYASWYGHVDVVSVLLEAGCSPNIANNNHSMALHFAALCGHHRVVNLLLQHPQVDISPFDRERKTPLDHCDPVLRPDWQQCAYLLKKANQKVQVFLMDGSDRRLSLIGGENTTVYQLNLQLLKALNLSESYTRVFTVWVCSQSLELQLKLDHKPLDQLRDWKRICVRLTDGNPNDEEPVLMWRRDALLSPGDERKVDHPTAIRLLFHEAYHNYIKALYPCDEKDVHMFAAILLYISQGEFDTNKTKAYFANAQNLQSLVPIVKMKARGTNYLSKIQQQYKLFSAVVSERDKSTQALHSNFLRWCRNLTVYGSAFFNGSLILNAHPERGPHRTSSRSQTRCLIAVNDVGIHLIHAETRDMIQSCKYVDIEWHQIPERPILEIKSRPGVGSTSSSSSQRSLTTTVRTKQAGLVNVLMNKLAQLCDNIDS